MEKHEVVLGIDLGTTFSAIAVVNQHGSPIIIPNCEGGRTTPSVIHFYDSDGCLVGEEAVRMVVVDPSNVARFVKRSMGESDFSMEFFRRPYTPQELSALILRKLKNDAEQFLGHQVRDAVISVPAYFNSPQRGATAEAGALAGLNVLSIINEPTAAAIAYGVDRQGPPKTILVFDLGGGTFDVTVMDIRPGSLKTLASDGNAELGGKDWDDRLLNYVSEHFIERFGDDPRDDPNPYQELYERILEAKLALSSRSNVRIPVNYRGHWMFVDVDEPLFRDLCQDLLDQCRDTCNIVMEKAGIGWEKLDEILLVGGATRMPMIRNMISDMSGLSPIAGVNPDECIAMGAALAGIFRHRQNMLPSLLEEALPTSITGSASADSGLPKDSSSPAMPLARLEIVDITTHPLGVLVLDADLQEHVVNLIPEGTPLPCEKSGRFAYAYDNMTTVCVQVAEGHGSTRDEVVVVGEVILDHLPPRVRGTPVEVLYRYTRNQLLEVYVTDIQTSNTQRATINLKGSLPVHRFEKAKAMVSRAKMDPLAP